MTVRHELSEQELQEHGRELADIPVSALMTPNPATIREHTSIRNAVQLVIEKRVAGLPVVDEKGRLVGVVSENDLLLLAASGRMSRALQFTRAPDTLTPDTTLKQALIKMIRLKRKWFPVVDADGKVIGVLARADILSVLLEKER
ncbi:MAG: CBS domain-containing protein [Desulfobacterota bacterium]|nr:CBS domain-containing protein [Thermodesulfobacteriota bacterium]